MPLGGTGGGLENARGSSGGQTAATVGSNDRKETALTEIYDAGYDHGFADGLATARARLAAGKDV